MSSVSDKIRMDLLLDALQGKDVSNLTIIFGTCKDCKHCMKDFSFTDKPMCLSHALITVNDDFYCADFEKRGSENG